MSKLSKSDLEKTQRLENAVLCETPDKVEAILKDLGEVRFSARALGFACRFRGLDMVKILVENGVTFEYDEKNIQFQFLEIFNVYFSETFPDFARFLLKSDDIIGDQFMGMYVKHLTNESKRKGKDLEVISNVERLKVLTYLCENKEKAKFNINEFLYYTIFEAENEASSALEKKMLSVLKESGAVLSEDKKNMITNGVRGIKWNEYCFFVHRLPDRRYIPVMSEIASEIGAEKKLHINDLLMHIEKDRLLDERFFEFFLDNFNMSKVNKTKLMKEIIDRGSVFCLRKIAERGWLKLPKKRDEMIDYSAQRNKTECTAYLLDFKNRTADIAAERAKEEKKLERELNAAPDSVAALKKIWRYEKNDDGTIKITSYKGSRTVIIVPEKIGKSIVTEIGDNAFSWTQPRISLDTAKFRQTITSITLPKTIRKIGIEAFCGCPLENMIIPEGVTEIGENAFGGYKPYHMDNNIKLVTLPGTLEFFQSLEAAQKAPKLFYLCPGLTVIIPKSHAAKKYCEIHSYNYRYE